MLRLKNLSNKYQKRLIRPLYAQTQATPYAATLDAQTLTGPNADTGRTSFRNADGSRYLSKSGDTSPLNTRTADAFITKTSLAAGLVVVRTVGDTVAIATGINDGTVERPFGLLANFVGGDLDDIGDEENVGVWRGPDAVFELLAPAFNDAGLAAAATATPATTGNYVKLYAGEDGRLCAGSQLDGGSADADTPFVAYLIERVSASRIVIDLAV